MANMHNGNANVLSNGLSRRQVLAAGATAALSLPMAQFLAACGDDDSEASGSLTFIKSPHDDRDRQFQLELSEKFAARNDGVTVKPTFYAQETVDADLTAAFSADSPPDIAYLVTRVWTRFAESGTLADLRERVDESSFKRTRDAIPAQLWDSITGENGEIWGVPWLGAIFPLYVNLDLVKRAGVQDWQRSWSNLYDAAAAIRSGDVFGFSIAQTFQEEAFHDLGAYIHDGGGDLLGPDGQPSLDVPGVVEAFELLLRMHTEGLAPEPGLYDGEGKKALFKAGRVGIAHGPISLIPELAEEEPAFAWDVAMVPEGPVTRTAYGDFGYLSIAADSPNQDEAWDYIKFLSEPDQVVDYLVKLGRRLQPVRSDVADDLFPGGDSPAKRLVTEFVPQVKPYSAFPEQVEALRGLVAEYELTIRGDKSPSDAVAAANERVSQIVGA